MQSRGAGPGLVGRMMGSLRGMGGAVAAEEAARRALRVEISGLETVEAGLASKVAVLRARRLAQLRADTWLGRLLALPVYGFAIYCVFRVLATTMTALRRLAFGTSPSFGSSDPISRLLGLLARHWDPTLDQAAWARQMSFLLSGAILAASATSALQTLRLLARLLPGAAAATAGVAAAPRPGCAREVAPLLAAQVAATYVISATLLLRGSLPPEVVDGGAVAGALCGALRPAFVDGWFDGWFLAAAAATAAAIWVGRKLDGPSTDPDDWDDYDFEEAGQKRLA